MAVALPVLVPARRQPRGRRGPRPAGGTLAPGVPLVGQVAPTENKPAYLRRMLTNLYISQQRPRARRLEHLTDAPPEPHQARPPAPRTGW